MQDEPKTGDEQKAEVPAEDVPSSESPEEAVDQPQPEEQENPETDTGKNEGSDVPKDNAAWAKMRTENKRLKQTLDEVDPEYLERLRGATTSHSYPAQNVPDVTEETDYSQLTQSLNWTQRQAAQANQKLAELQNRLEEQQDREAEDAYPRLKTDKSFQQIVAEKKLAARVLGHNRTTKEIASEVERLLGQREQQAAVQSAEETEQRLAQKQAAIADARGTTSGGKTTVEDESLRVRVRKGDQEAASEVAKGLIADLEF
jgi:hypothetical protein